MLRQRELDLNRASETAQEVYSTLLLQWKTEFGHIVKMMQEMYLTTLLRE